MTRAFPTAEVTTLVQAILDQRAAAPPPPPEPDDMPAPRPRARRMGRGRLRTYTVGKRNDARPGTWRHFMIRTIQDHGDTWDAEAAMRALPADHAHQGKKLDWTWTAHEGYINWS